MVPIITIGQPQKCPEATLARGTRLNSATFIKNDDIWQHQVQTVVQGADLHLTIGQAVPFATGQAIARAAYRSLHEQGAFKPQQAKYTTGLTGQTLNTDSVLSDPPRTGLATKRSLIGL